MKINEIIVELREPLTKGDWVEAKRNIVLHHMLGTNYSLRNVATAAKFLDGVLQQMRSDSGWTDDNGDTHHANDPYKGQIGDWPPDVQPVVSKTGTPDPYKKDVELRASKHED